jgi:hypothetical protein
MTFEPRPPITLALSLSPLAIAGVSILLLALLREPARRRFSAILVAGAGAAYLSGGLGVWEFGFCALMTVVAYRGLEDYRFVGAAWVLHTVWDVAHHLWGHPIIPVLPMSSFGCAICDLGLAAWYFAGAPSPYPWVARVKAAA